MKKEKAGALMTISEFSRISEIKRKALIFYDNIGVFSPKYTAPNGYRYYSHEQIYVISVINVLKELGMPLSKIKEYTSDISPESAIDLLKKQGENLNQKIEELQAIQDMLEIKLKKLEEGVHEYSDSVVLQYFEKVPVFISDDFDSDRGNIADDIWLDFYLKCKQNQTSFGYPEGYLVKEENLRQGRICNISNIIAYVNNTSFSNTVIPAGYYVTACGHGGLDSAEKVYNRIFDHIKKNQYKIAGNAYEERLIDEVGSSDKNGQVIRIRIKVEPPEVTREF